MLCILNCIFTGSNASGIQQTFIDNRNYPGGPWGYVTVGIVTAPFNFTSEVSYFLGNIMADALLVRLYRYHFLITKVTAHIYVSYGAVKLSGWLVEVLRLHT